jgi:uncharacterized protein (TIGR01732 family)
LYSGYGSGFVLIVVLFILLIIVGTSSFLPIIINRINIVDIPVHIYQPFFVNEIVDGDTTK